MRILWQSNAPWCPTGYGKVTAQVTPRIVKLGYDLAIFAFYGLKDSRLSWEGITVYPNNEGDWGQKEMPQYYKHFNADVLITLVDAWVLGGYGQMARWYPYTPVDHDPIPPFLLSKLQGAQAPIAMSQFGANEIARHNQAVYYAPHGVDTKVYFPNPETRQAFRKFNNIEDKFVVGFVGTNKVERKNIQCVMESFAQFHKRYPDSVLYMHTDPNDKEGLRINHWAEQLHIGGDIQLPETVHNLLGLSEEQMAMLYNGIDVFLLPSKGEGFGIPIIEAQACGTPVIVTDFTSMPELVGGGWTIKNYIKKMQLTSSWWAEADVTETVSLLRKAYRLWSTNKLKPIQEQARQKALEYDWDTVVEKYWKPLLEDMAANLTASKAYYIQRAREEDIKWAQMLSPQFAQAGAPDVWYNLNRNKIGIEMLGHICDGKKVLALGARGFAERHFLDQIEDAEITRTDLIGDAELQEVDALNMPFEDESFDVVICRELIEHVPDDFKMMSEISRVLKEKGHLFITTPNLFNVPPDGREHVRGYSPEEFAGLLEYWGYKIVQKRGNVPNIFSGLLRHVRTKRRDKTLVDFLNLDERMENNPDNYYLGTQLHVLAQKVTPKPVKKLDGEPELDIVVETHNHLELTQKCIDKLYANTSVPFKLTIIDDQSTDGTLQYVKNLIKEKGNVKLVAPDHKLKSGAEQLNIALRSTELPYIVFMNNDVEVLPGWIERALDLLIYDNEIGMVGFKLLYKDGSINHAGIVYTDEVPTGLHRGRWEPRYKETHMIEVDAVTGACMLARREAIKDGWDEETFDMWTGCEDTDLCRRIKQQGWVIIYHGKCEAYHSEVGSIPRDEAFWQKFRITKEKYIKKWLTDKK